MIYILSTMALSPIWFYGLDVVSELLFAVTCMMVAIFAISIYRRTGQRLVKYFGVSFSLISISYFIQSILNMLLISKLTEDVSMTVKTVAVISFESLATLIHMLFMTAGISILLYTTLKDRSQRTLWLVILVALSSVFFSQNYIYMFYVISTIYLAFISWHYVQKYKKIRQPRTLLVALAFLFLLFGSFHFLISVNHQIFYPIGRILEFFAYLLILINLYLVRKK